MPSCKPPRFSCTFVFLLLLREPWGECRCLDNAPGTPKASVRMPGGIREGRSCPSVGGASTLSPGCAGQLRLRHFREFGQIRVHMVPGLGTGGIDVHAG